MVFKGQKNLDFSLYRNLVDEELVLKSRAGDVNALEYLISKYSNYIKLKAKNYYLIGADGEDIYQEGMIGLYKAIRDYEQEKLSNFKSFADLCITRQILTAISTASRQKHIPLNSYVSLNKPLYKDNEERTLIDTIEEEKNKDPMDIFIGRENLESIKKIMEQILSPLEIKVLNLYVDGLTYEEISREIGKDIKSVDNSLQRVKKKLVKTLEKNP